MFDYFSYYSFRNIICFILLINKIKIQLIFYIFKLIF
jgi:hypothetical protein